MMPLWCICWAQQVVDFKHHCQLHLQLTITANATVSYSSYLIMVPLYFGSRWYYMSQIIFYLFCCHTTNGNAVVLFSGAANMQGWQAYMLSEKRKQIHIAINQAKWWILLHFRIYVLKGVSSYSDARNCPTRFRIDTPRWAGWLLEIFCAPCLWKQYAQVKTYTSRISFLYLTTKATNWSL